MTTPIQTLTNAEIIAEMCRLLRLLSKRADAAMPVHSPDRSANKLILIQQAICDVLRTPIAVMSSRARPDNYVQARHIAMFLSRELTEYSMQDIAKSFRPTMNHSTITHGHRACLDRMMHVKGFESLVDACKQRALKLIDNAGLPLFQQSL